jgi:hypothetical protein
MEHWGLCTIRPDGLLPWIECHPGLAGYLQAIGVVAAVAMAFLAPNITARFQRKQAQDEIKQNTRRFIPTLDKAMVVAVRTCQNIETKIILQQGPPTGGNAWSDWFQSIAYVMPWELAQMEQIASNCQCRPLSLLRWATKSDICGVGTTVMCNISHQKKTPIALVQALGLSSPCESRLRRFGPFFSTSTIRNA